MTSVPPLIIASCPSRSISGTQADVGRAADGGADLAEVRIDRLNPGDRLRLGEFFPSRIPLVATLRSRTEGGEGPDAAKERARVLKFAASLPFRFLDLELDRDEVLLDAIARGESVGPTLIVSSHLPASTAVEELRRRLERPRPPGAVVKVVVECSVGRLFEEVLPGLMPLDAFAPCILHTTGGSGPLLRSWARRFGMFAVYGAVPTDPGGGVPPVESSQIPVDQLRSYFRSGSDGSLFAVTGHPILHSQSPAIHSFWLKREDRRGLYMALDIETAEELAASLGPLASGGFRGLNVTHPWKQVALSLASRAGPAAEAAACANTVTFDSDGVAAENTDVAAVRRRLLELRAAEVWDGTPVLVLGAGGAARAVLAAVRSVGGSGLVVSRRPQVAKEIAREYGATAEESRSIRPARIVFHATPAGREGVPRLELPWEQAITSSTHVVDFVYRPAYPFLRTGTEARGGTYEDGSRLLVYQAAESYGIWWGSPPSAELQATALKEVMCTA